MKITILSASPRQGSNSLKFAKHLQNLLAPAGHETKIFSFQSSDIPMVGRASLDPAQLTDFQKQLTDSWNWGELIFLVVPEYNWNTGGELINALDQLGNKDFAYLFDNKVFAIAGVSSGRGGRMPAIEMTIMVGKLINFLNQHSVISPRLFESHDTSVNIDENGNSTGNELYEKGTRAFVEYSLKIAERWFK